MDDDTPTENATTGNATAGNDTLRKLDAGEAVHGAWLLSGSPRAGEVLSRTGLDWIGIDTEHATYSPERVESVVRAVERDATPIVRLPSVEAAVAGAAKRALDAGAGGVIVPGVERVADAERAVAAATFPPAGERGAAGTVRANGYGERFDDYLGSANDDTLVVVQLESRTAVDRATEILAVDGIDVAFVGENDLSTALGHPGEKGHPTVVDAVDRVFEAARANGVHPGIAGRTPETMRERTDRGFRFFLLGAELSFMRRGVEAFLDE
ncbi:2-dehydro-3-deoxyglucarate aldolase [Halorubrum sp. JWXQ-INN 858]|uniref:HpcH/HpaI aldolase family protein n=1 Tax=Halorubrum sp. JWXQ-INN 858 TaxID=2690782 RepID=UPI0013591782|nr:aldolase/citrate lyase family protein [Halorubrum sp. JWXQ-INN 858]MWV64604.1 2-dehydro-3-deoxyglucarate aldolase [Halorubrum sp. JWXQ-INN 858]